MQHAAAGDRAFVDEDYAAAIQAYTKVRVRGYCTFLDQVPFLLVLAASWAWPCLAVVAVSVIYLSERRTDLPWLSWLTLNLLLLV